MKFKAWNNFFLYRSSVEIPSNAIKYAKIWFIDIQVLEFLMVQNYNFPQKLNKYMLPHNFFPLFKKAGCSNVLLQANNTLKHEIQIDNLFEKLTENAKQSK